MPYFSRFFKFIPIIFCGSSILVGCQSPKVNQCYQLAQVTNSGKSLTVAQNSGEFIKLADSLDRLNLKVKEIALTDQNLDGFKAKFVKMYDSTAQSSRQIAQATTAKNPNLLLQAQQNLQTQAAQEIALVAEVNKYCGQK